MITIPLVGGAVNSHQTQYIQLGDNFCELVINYITITGDWVMDISVEGVSKMSGVMLKPSCEVSAIYNAGLGRFFFVGDEPTLDNLGTDNALVWYE